MVSSVWNSDNYMLSIVDSIMKKYVAKIFYLTIILFFILDSQAISDNNPQIKYKIENVQQESQIATDLDVDDKFGPKGNIRLEFAIRGDVVVFPIENNELFKDKKNLGNISLKISLEKLKNNNYQCCIELSYLSPEGIINSSKLKFEFNDDTIKELKEDRQIQEQMQKGFPLDWAKEVRDSAIMNRYKHQYLFEYNFEKALAYLGSL